jgi:hypothetical protein
MIEPIKVLTAMITPGVMISAAALLLLSTANRLGRVNDRLLRLMAELERLGAHDKPAAARAEKKAFILAQLAGLTDRLVLLRSGVTGTYVTIAVFLSSSIIGGLNVVFPEMNSLIRVSVGMIGAVAFLYSIVVLIGKKKGSGLFFSRTAAGPERGAEVQPPGSPLHPEVAAIGRSPPDATPQRLDFGFRLRPIDQLQPVSRAWHRPFRQQPNRIGVTVLPPPKAAPAPFFRATHEAGP